ncbi:MAG: cob(I)yrinic acid a,c-diamide adenosyltransferase [Planctomycetota bacterium]|nr:cob(I)yrinic acid a,c-diamide adenosyltransferase [Planctomycetota bacterium]
MIRLDKIYTGGGDEGETSLADGSRVSKADLRVEAYGAVDELNAVVGICRTYQTEKSGDEGLARIQNQLFNLGADLASPSQEKGVRVSEEDVQQVEEWIDTHNEKLEPLTSFVLPQGGDLAVSFHHARTVCRRAERRCVQLSEAGATLGRGISYLNRLSDLFFVLARTAAEGEETLWVEEAPPD